MAMKVLLLPFVVFWSFKTTAASYTIGISYNHFQCPAHEAISGQDKDHGSEYERGCGHKFKICLDLPNGIPDDHNVCQVTAPFELDLDKGKRIAVDQPWQGDILIKVSVLKEDHTNHVDPVDKLSHVIRRHAYQSNAGVEWSVSTINGSHSWLQLYIGVHCNINWNGPHCDCNDADPHHRCHGNGNKSCDQHWYGPDCNVWCAPASGLQRYACLNNGTKFCDDDYYGEHCDKYCKATDDETGHYTCAEDGSKICHKNWCNVNCDIPCSEITTPRSVHRTSPKPTLVIPSTPGTASHTTEGITDKTNEIITARTIIGVTRTTSSHIGTTLTGVRGAKTTTDIQALAPNPPIIGVGGFALLLAIAFTVFYCLRKQKCRRVKKDSLPVQLTLVRHNNDTTGDAMNTTDVARNITDDAMNVTDSMLIVDNELYGSASEKKQTGSHKTYTEIDLTDDMLIEDDELYARVSAHAEVKLAQAHRCSIETQPCLTLC